MWPNPQVPADLVTFTEQIRYGKLHFLCSDGSILRDTILYCVLWNNIAFHQDAQFDRILRPIEKSSILQFHVAQYVSLCYVLWNNIASWYNFILRPMIWYCCLWFHIAQCELILRCVFTRHSSKSYYAI